MTDWPHCFGFMSGRTVRQKFKVETKLLTSLLGCKNNSGRWHTIPFKVTLPVTYTPFIRSYLLKVPVPLNSDISLNTQMATQDINDSRVHWCNAIVPATGKIGSG